MFCFNFHNFSWWLHTIECAAGLLCHAVHHVVVITASQSVSSGCWCVEQFQSRQVVDPWTEAVRRRRHRPCNHWKQMWPWRPARDPVQRLSQESCRWWLLCVNLQGRNTMPVKITQAESYKDAYLLLELEWVYTTWVGNWLIIEYSSPPVYLIFEWPLLLQTVHCQSLFTTCYMWKKCSEFLGRNTVPIYQY